MNSSVFFITGTSGAGKNWRKQRTNGWLKKAQVKQGKGKSTVICGVSVPAEVKESPSFRESLNVYFGFIVINDTEIRRRLHSIGVYICTRYVRFQTTKATFFASFVAIRPFSKVAHKLSVHCRKQISGFYSPLIKESCGLEKV
jgi:hypothetical protein